MSEESSFKMQKLLWSFVLIGAVTLFVIWRFYHNQSPLGYGFDLWVLFIMMSFLTLLISPIIVLLRLLRVIKNKESFGYILIGSINFCIGASGLYFEPYTHIQRGYYGLLIMYIVNLLIFVFIFTDTFIKAVPGLRKE